MKLRVPTAIAASLALSLAAPVAAFAQEAPSPFRSVEAQTFTANDRLGPVDADLLAPYVEEFKRG